MAFYEQGQIESSAAASQHPLAQDPSDREAMQMEGVALFRLGKAGAAVPLLEQAHLSIPRTNIESNYVLGLCYLDTRRYDDARKAFATQYGFPPESPSAYLLAARMMLRRDYLPVADSLLQKALSLNPRPAAGTSIIARPDPPRSVSSNRSAGGFTRESACPESGTHSHTGGGEDHVLSGFERTVTDRGNSVA